MNNLEKDIKVALSLLSGKIDVRGLENYKKINSTNCENLGDYFKCFSFRNNVFTALDSGDKILQAVSMGAKSIYTFYNNPLELYIAKLKMVLVFYCSLDKFKNFFYNEDGVSYFAKDYYDLIKYDLGNDLRVFWDEIYKHMEYRQQLDNLIIGPNKNNNKGFYSYLNGSNYLSLKEKISDLDIKFYCSDVYDVLSKIPSDIKFDSVFLSNVFDSMNFKDKIMYPLFIKKDLDKRLYDKGKVVVYSSPSGKIDNALSIIFEDTINVDNHNKVIIYKK